MRWERRFCLTIGSFQSDIIPYEGGTPMTTLRRFITRIDAHTLWAFNAPRSSRG